ncbi:MAG TPA: hypothetical protein VFK05_33500 [Polyangiaceae bacterium]|nr:hypothetical protein [Polyangiaceae bacterium]
MMTRVGNPRGYDFSALVCVLAAALVGCSNRVDLGASLSPPEPVTNEHELAAQTTNLARVGASQISSLAIDGEFLYFAAAPAPAYPSLWRCRKSDCWATLVTIAGADGSEYSPVLGLHAGRLGWRNGMCDAPDCVNRLSLGFPIWDERFGYFFDDTVASIYRCEIADCIVGTGFNRAWRGTLVASRAQPRYFTRAEDRLYWLDVVEGITRARVDGMTPAERLSLSNATEWTTSRAGLQLAGDVTVIDLELDGAYVYAALNVSNPNADARLGCDPCTPGIAIARWQYATPGAAREWVLMNDADLTDLIHLKVFGGEVIWGSADGNLWSCLANDCSASKRQIGVRDAMSKVAPFPSSDPSRVDLIQPDFELIAVDEQAIFWLSVPCYPHHGDCSVTGTVDWTLKRTPRIAQ